MRNLILASAFLLVLLAACKAPAPAPLASGSDVVRTNFPDTLTQEQIYLSGNLLPAGTRFTKHVLPSGQYLNIVLPTGTKLKMRNGQGAEVETNEVCFACECLGEGNCEIALMNIQGGSLGFLQGNCRGEEILGWFCDEPITKIN
jgi:hypothetical protein